MATYKYMKLEFRLISEEIRLQYKLYELVESDGYVYINIRKGMYGLKQVARLAFDNLFKLLTPHGYHPIKHHPGLWRHITRPTLFTLCVNNFRIKYISQEDADHLINSIKQNYKVSIDPPGTHYLGLTLNWNYKNPHINIFLPEYVHTSLKNSYTFRQNHHSTHPTTGPH